MHAQITWYLPLSELAFGRCQRKNCILRRNLRDNSVLN